MLRRFAQAIVLLLIGSSIAGCATNRTVVTRWQKPKAMSSVDARIAMAECEKQSLHAYKRNLPANKTSEKKGVHSPAFQAKLAAQDRCMRAHGVKKVGRTYY